MKEQSEKQYKLIQQLKSQLEDLETYAYEVWIPLLASLVVTCVACFSLPFSDVQLVSSIWRVLSTD